MRIAVVDDEKMFQIQLQMLVKRVSEEMEIDFEVELFSNGSDFITALSDRRFDVVFMDIFMPDMDGIATAKKMRELTERTFLVFLTASEGHYPEAFALHAFDYVTKPFAFDRIKKVMTEVVEHTPMDEAFVKLSIGNLEQKLYLREIISVTTDGHYLDVILESAESVRVRLTAGNFLELAQNDARFLVANRGIIINMEHIKEYNSEEITMSNGDVFPVSIKKSAQVLSLIKDYTFRNN